MTEVRINNARFYAHHGVFDYEKTHGNEFGVDIIMKCDLSDLKDSDDLHKTVNYQSVYKLAEKVFKENKFNLIETVNKKLCMDILENFPLVKSVIVKIRKPNAPLGIIDSVEIINEISREEI
ncbi:MAG: Bifunctional folate synthesis protein [Ignavibacteria bacterium]|nr:Bifunctional folate synthesis protein [Ignavibacteria bacterium]